MVLLDFSIVLSRLLVIEGLEMLLVLVLERLFLSLWDFGNVYRESVSFFIVLNIMKPQKIIIQNFVINSHCASIAH